MRIEKCKKMRNSFCFIFDEKIEPGETVILTMPRPNQNHRGINDIGWQCDSDFVELFGTLAAESDLDTAIWQEIATDSSINCTTNMLKIMNNGEAAAHVIVRVSLF